MTLAINRKILLVDAALVAGACLIPAASHLLALPLYMLDPMRWLLLAAMLVGLRSDNLLSNGLLMALLLPLTSSLVVGMPALSKALVIVAELGVNVALFALISKKTNAFVALLLSILAAKGVYYLLKAALLDGVLVNTPWMLQVVVAFAMSLTAFLVMKRR